MNTQAESVQSTTLNVGGISCSGCAATVREALNNIDGVSDAKVDLENESVSDRDAVSISDFKQAVEDARFEFRGER